MGIAISAPTDTSKQLRTALFAAEEVLLIFDPFFGSELSPKGNRTHHVAATADDWKLLDEATRPIAAFVAADDSLFNRTASN